MRTKLFPLLLLALVGCGGSGTVPAPINPFRGSWNGPISSPISAGSLDIIVAMDGTISGSIINNTAGINGGASGSVSVDGDIHLIVTYPSVNPTHSYGTVALDGQGRMAGTMDTVTLLLDPQ